MSAMLANFSTDMLVKNNMIIKDIKHKANANI